MISEIVVGYTPSNKMSDWKLSADGEHNWWYEPRGVFYCTVHEKKHLCTPDAAYRDVGREPFYNLKDKVITDPRVHITHYPRKGEWEHLKTIDDVRQSELAKHI